MRRIVERRVPERHDAIGHILIDRPLMLQNNCGHGRQVAIEEICQAVRVEAFRNRCEPADVAEHHSELALFTAEDKPLRMIGELLDYRGREVAAEGMTHMPALSLRAE